MPPNGSGTPAAAQHRALKWLMLVMVVTGLGLTAWRHLGQSELAAAPGDRLWDVEVRITADATAGKTTVHLAAPLDTRFLRAIGQNISHPGWRQSFRQGDGDEPVRRIGFVAARDGTLSLHAVFSVHASATPRLAGDPGAAPLESALREQFLRDHTLLQIEHPAVQEVVQALLPALASEDRLPEAMFDRVLALRERTGPGLLEVPEILSGGRANARERAYTLVALCRAAHVPARLVRGLVLRDATATELHFWVEVHQAGRWVPYDPVVGYRGEVPQNYLPLVRGLNDVVSVAGTSSYSVSYAIVNTDPLLDLTDPIRADWRDLVDLTRLSLETRIVLAALLLLPFGVVLNVVFAEVVGIRTYGVFTPTLLALSLTHVPWEPALVVLVTVLLLGIVGRAAVGAGLGRVPRLAIVLILVALGISASASLMAFMQIEFGGQLVLLPIVILASLVDRFYTVFDERGLRAALTRLGWTLLVAILCVPIVQYEALGHAMVRYPELHLVTLAGILLLSLYRGRRLVQLPAFAWLAWPDIGRAAGRGVQ